MVALGACSGGPDQVADAGSPDIDADEISPDAGPAGLNFHFIPVPNVPGSFSGNYDYTIERADFALRDLRAVGDTGAVNRGSFDLRFREVDGRTWLTFENAQPGLYSRLSADLYKVEIRGQVTVSDGLRNFRIEIDLFPDVDLGIDFAPVPLEAGGSREVQIDVDVGSLIDAVDWDEVDSEEGELRIEQATDEEAEAMIERLADGFSAHSPD